MLNKARWLVVGGPAGIGGLALASIAVLALCPARAWSALQDQGQPASAGQPGIQGGDAIEEVPKATKGALKKSVPLSPNMKVPPHFSTPPKATKVEPAATDKKSQATPPGQPGATPPAPPPPAGADTAPAGAGTGKAPDFGYSPQEAWEVGIDYKPKPKGFKFSMTLEDLDLSELVKHISKLTGKKFVVGNKVKQNIKATIIASTPITVDEAYKAFLSVLEINDLTIVPDGSFYKIVDSAAGQASLSVPVLEDGKKVPGGSQVVTQIVHLDYVAASDMQQLLAKFISKGADLSAFGSSTLIISDFSTNIKRLLKLINELDRPGTGDQIWVEPVNYADATEMADMIQKVLEAAGIAGAGGSGGKGGKAAAPGGAIAAAPGGGEGSAAAHVSSIIAEERTNSLIVVASEAAYLKVIQLLTKLDVKIPGEGEIHVHALQHADAEELSNVLGSLVQGMGKAHAGKDGAGAGVRAGEMFEGEVKVTFDAATNSLVITASERDYASLRTVIDKLDQARRQVFVEAVIMEVQLSKLRTLGVALNGGSSFETMGEDSLLFGGTTFGSLSSIILDPTSLTGLALGLRGPEISEAEGILGTGISIPAFGVMINALQSNNDVNILSTPNILATDNETAEITVGGNVPIQQGYNAGLSTLGALAGSAGAQATGALSSIGGLGGLSSMYSIGRQDVGLTLKITPHINDSDQVRMEIELEISEVTGESDLGPLIDQRMAKTVSVVKDQQTVVLGGLVKDNITETVDKVPFLGDIPILGYLFKKKKTRITKTNLLIFITPYIIRDATDFKAIFNRKMEERREFIEQFTAFESGAYEPAIDYTRTNGLVEEIHKTMLELEAEQALIEQLMLAPLPDHEPEPPIDETGDGGSGEEAPADGEPAAPAEGG